MAIQNADAVCEKIIKFDCIRKFEQQNTQANLKENWKGGRKYCNILHRQEANIPNIQITFYK